MNKPIQPVAWDILPREDEPLVVWALPFPASWRATLLQLEQERTGRIKDVQLPIAPLNVILTALCSQIMIVPGYARAEVDASVVSPRGWSRATQFRLR